MNDHQAMAKLYLYTYIVNKLTYKIFQQKLTGIM